MKRRISILLTFLFLFLLNSSFALTEKDFKHSMNFYQKLVEKKVSVEELIFTLDKILRKYKDIGVNLTPVKEKLLVLRKFKGSRDYYRKLEEKPASIDERITTLRRILTKFRNSDADLSGMEKELGRLQEEKARKGKKIEEVRRSRVEKSTEVAEVEEEFRLEEEAEEFKLGERSGPEIEEDFEEFEEFEP